MRGESKDGGKILLVDDDLSNREALSLILGTLGYAVTTASSGEEALKRLRSDRFEVVITDLFLPGVDGIGILQEVKKVSPGTEVVLITGHASAESAVRAMKEGAYDYIVKPVNVDELRIVLDKAREKHRLVTENVYLREQLRDKFEFANIIGSSPAMQKVFSRIRKILNTDSTVLILGESGTGKELVAKAIHFNSPRKDKPFVAVNCAAIPENLLESELFGHTRGSFTGAIRDKMGKFEAANNGTIFLDEIGIMPLPLQAKLLRVLQEQEVERVGSSKPIKLSIRVISATNNNLMEEIRNGNFREDLYYRLNVIPITLPPLRERPEDILPLVRHFIDKNCREMKVPLLGIEKEAVKALELYGWPGNVRELENVIERTVALAEGTTLTLNDLPHQMQEEVLTRVTERGVDLVRTVNEIEKKMILEALAVAGGVKAQAAVLLRINRTTLVEKMKRLGIEA